MQQIHQCGEHIGLTISDTHTHTQNREKSDYFDNKKLTIISIIILNWLTITEKEIMSIYHEQKYTKIDESVSRIILRNILRGYFCGAREIR